MPRRRRGSIQRARGGVKNNVWTTILLDEVIVGTGITSVSAIVTDTDWSVSGERATILTCRGWLSVCGQNDTLTKSEGQVFWYIGTQDANVDLADIPQPQDVATYAAANILATGGFIMDSALGAAGGFYGRRSRDWDINLKTMRTVRSGVDLNFVIANRSGDDIRVGAVFRALLRKGGN